MDQNIINKCGRYILAPILLKFTIWLMDEAQKIGVSTLYFMARDGYVLYHVAKSVCRQFGLKIECKYLCCSRKSLNLPVYQFDSDYAYEHIFTANTYCTFMSILRRAGVTDAQLELILQDVRFDRQELNRRLQIAEIESLKETVKNSTVFNDVLMQNSREAYKTTLGYLKQEGLLDQKTVAVVDSGWSGSSQRALQKLLRRSGYGGSVQGYYFGMYTDYPEEKFRAKAWYFSQRENLWNKVFFSPSLLECMLSAPDGMTIGYQYINGMYVPVKKHNLPEKHRIAKETQLNAILEACESYTDKHINSVKAKLRFWRFMVFPTEQEVQSYGMFQFSDDIAGENNVPLCCSADAVQVKDYTFLKIVRNRLKHKKSNTRNPYWIYGAISLIPERWKKNWLRINAIGLEGYRWLRMKSISYKE